MRTIKLSMLAVAVWISALSACGVDETSAPSPAEGTEQQALGKGEAAPTPSCTCPNVISALPPGGKGGTGGEEGALQCEGCELCWNQICDNGETSANCPQDCGPAGWCGDGVCRSGESQWSCPSDCGYPSYCGDGSCGAGEDASNCPSDCGAQTCGDCFCGPGEWSTCPADCNLPPGTCV
jgi:hypothetical protein